MKAELVPENGDPPITITRDLTLVGRHEDCDVVIAHPSLSKRHCLVVKTDGLLVIRDLATTNGTKVKGQRVRWAALLPEDRVSFGAYKVRIYLGSDDMPAPSEQRRGRNGGVAARGAARPATQAEYSGAKATERVPLRRNRRGLSLRDFQSPPMMELLSRTGKQPTESGSPARDPTAPGHSSAALSSSTTTTRSSNSIKVSAACKWGL